MFVWNQKLTYSEFPHKFVWDQKLREWRLRKQRLSIGRIYSCPPGVGDRYYLRCLLNYVRGHACYDDIKLINGVQHTTYVDACYALGLLDDDREYIDGIIEASHWATASSLRNLFATLLLSSCLTQPNNVWDLCWSFLADDIIYRRRQVMGNQELRLSDDDIKGFALVEVENLLQKWGRSLKEFPSLRFPSSRFFGVSGNPLILEEFRYDKIAFRENLKLLLCNLNDEQRNVYDTVMAAVKSNLGGVFFVYGYSGTGKTYVWKTLSAAIRSEGEIVLNVASSGITSLLLRGGRTAHSRFHIPINVNEDSTCNIKQGSHLADLLIRCKLIIWDEAPMMHKHCFEALDKTMRDILRFSEYFEETKPFGGKTVIFGGDFRQILHVIPKGSRQQIVNATINSSYLWRHCKVLRLTKNMRLQSLGKDDCLYELKEFADWIAAVGDGVAGGANDGDAIIQIPNDILLPYDTDAIQAAVKSTFPSLRTNSFQDGFFKGRSILAPTLDVVDCINECVLSMNDHEGTTYLSLDSTCSSEAGASILEDIHTPEFLNSVRCSGTPNHVLNLKLGTPVMLLQNIDYTRGLCNGTRLLITRLGAHVLEGKILVGTNEGESVLIPRLTLTPNDPMLPFKLKRRQFPIIVSYAMSINKSQGQSLCNVGLFLKSPVFSHGQLYIALSRVTNRRDLKIVLCDEKDFETSSTSNVVYKKVFQNV